MKYRKLRIAWSVAWGLATLYLVVLTAREMQLRPLPMSVPTIMFGKPPLDVCITLEQGMLDVSSQSVGADGNLLWQFEIWIWQPILPAAVLMVVPWLPYRFSLRTLLIATTLIAVLLGLIMWAKK